MQTSTKMKTRVDGSPLAATTSATSANGRAKTVCENRMSCKKLVSARGGRSLCRSCARIGIKLPPEARVTEHSLRTQLAFHERKADAQPVLREAGAANAAWFSR